MSYPLRNFNHDHSRPLAMNKVAGKRAIERLDEIEALARATESQCRSWQWLKNFTALRVGGPIAAIVYPSTVSGAARLVQQLQQAGIRWRALGHGTSIVAGDDVHDFVAISLRLLDERLIFDDSLVHVHAGYSLIALVRAAAERGLSGLERFAGITGSLGGALRMKTETDGCDLWHLVESITIAEGGKAREVSFADIVSEDGQSCLIDDRLILAATLRLTKGNATEILAATEHHELRRLASLPDVQANAGRIFSDVSMEESFDDTTGELSIAQIVEKLGFKGREHGGARVSEANAGYIINEGTATADDVLELSDLIREEAEKLHGLKLEYDVDVWKNEDEDEGDLQ